MAFATTNIIEVERSIYMTPRFSTNHRADCRMTHAETCCQPMLRGRSGSGYFPDCNNGLDSELGLRNLSPVGMPPLGSHVGHIVGHGTNEDMVRVNASWRIAAMERFEAAWDWAILNLVGNAMREDRPLIRRSAANESIAPVINAARPKRTAIGVRLRNMGSESFREWPQLVRAAAFLGTKEARIVGELGLANPERIAAVRAFPLGVYALNLTVFLPSARRNAIAFVRAKLLRGAALSPGCCSKFRSTIAASFRVLHDRQYMSQMTITQRAGCVGGAA